MVEDKKGDTKPFNAGQLRLNLQKIEHEKAVESLEGEISSLEHKLKREKRKAKAQGTINDRLDGFEEKLESYQDNLKSEDEPLTPKQAAKICGVTPDTVRIWCRDGHLKHERIGSGKMPRYRIRRGALDAFVKSDYIATESAMQAVGQVIQNFKKSLKDKR